MLVLLPFQFVWGAAAGYCQHEEGVAVSHFGHHTHKHQSKSLKSTESTPDKKSALAGDDPDCSSCHLSCVTPVTTTITVIASQASEDLQAVHKGVHSPQISSSIDRPNWTLAA